MGNFFRGLNEVHRASRETDDASISSEKKGQDEKICLLIHEYIGEGVRLYDKKIKESGTSRSIISKIDNLEERKREYVRCLLSLVKDILNLSSDTKICIKAVTFGFTDNKNVHNAICNIIRDVYDINIEIVRNYSTYEESSRYEIEAGKNEGKKITITSKGVFEKEKYYIHILYDL